MPTKVYLPESYDPGTNKVYKRNKTDLWQRRFVNLFDVLGTDQLQPDMVVTVGADRSHFEIKYVQKLGTARDFSIVGDVVANAVSFDGTDNVVLQTEYSGVLPDALRPTKTNTEITDIQSRLGDLGTASNVDVGPGANEVPLNSLLGSAAYKDTGTGAGQLPTIDQTDAKYLDKSKNLSDLTSTSDARDNLELKSGATQDISVATTSVPGLINEAPNDGNPYVRENEAWVPQVASPMPKFNGPADFIRSSNTISSSGLVAALIDLEVGDVIVVSGTTSNDSTYTVESITDANNVVVNYEHRNGAGSLSLTDETGVSATIKLLCKWYNASPGLGQAWVDVGTVRAPNTWYTNSTGREIRSAAINGGTNGHIYLSHDGGTTIEDYPYTLSAVSFPAIPIPIGWSYKYDRNVSYASLEYR